MTLSLLEKSNYYRGLLVLARRDRTIDARERELMLQIGQMLDFDRRFCEAAMDDLLRNQHITDEPIVFPERRIAECFLRDGLRLAISDEEIHHLELQWLEGVAQANGLSREWVDREARLIAGTKQSLDSNAPLAIQQYL